MRQNSVSSIAMTSSVNAESNEVLKSAQKINLKNAKKIAKKRNCENGAFRFLARKKTASPICLRDTYLLVRAHFSLSLSSPRRQQQ